MYIFDFIKAKLAQYSFDILSSYFAQVFDEIKTPF